jgi:hypothetical protein
MTSEDETRRQSLHRDLAALWGMARAEATRRDPDMTPGPDGAEPARSQSWQRRANSKWSGTPHRAIREAPRELRRISTLSGPSRPTKSSPKALLMWHSGIVPKIFAVAPRHRRTPAARRLWGVSPSARRPEGPRPARSFRTQQERLRFFSCESIRTLDRRFPSVRAVPRGFPPSTTAM